MPEHPTLFNAWSVGRSLAGEKVQTRRLIQDRRFPWCTDPVAFYALPPEERPIFAEPAACRYENGEWGFYEGEYPEDGAIPIKCPYGQPGDLLWVRETWRQGTPAWNGPDFDGKLVYRADQPEWPPCKWRPSRHMPRWASRLTLEVIDVRVQRVQEISDEDAIAEGIEIQRPESWTSEDGWVSVHRVGTGYQDYSPTMHEWTDKPRYSFATLWDSINAKRAYGWDANPWVWAVSFHRLEGEHE